MSTAQQVPVGAVSNSGTPYVYVIDDHGNLLSWSIANGSSGNWTNLGTPSAVAIEGPIGVTIESSTPNVYVVDEENGIWQYNGQWSPLPALAVSMVNPVGVGTLAGSGCVYVTGEDGNLYCAAFNGGSWQWSPPISPPASTTLDIPIGVTSSADGTQLYAYLTGYDDHLYSISTSQGSWQDNGSSPSAVDGDSANDAGVGVASYQGNPTVFAVVLCADGNLYVNVSASWQLLGQPPGPTLQQCVGAVADNNDLLNSFALDDTGTLWWLNPAGTWTNVCAGQPYAGGVGITSTRNEIDVFLMGDDGNVYDCTFVFATSTWTVNPLS